MSFQDRWIEEANYRNDPRTRALSAAKWYEAFDEDNMTATVQVSIDVTEEEIKSLGLPSPLMYQAENVAYEFGCKMLKGEFEERESGLAASTDTISAILAKAESRVDEDGKPGKDGKSRFYYEEVMVEIPCEYEVCGLCRGKGKHVNPSIDASGISSADHEFWEDDYDPEYEDDDFEGDYENTGKRNVRTSRYMRGDYDVSCYSCKGNRVVPIPASHAPAVVLKAIHEAVEDNAMYEAEREAERRMGC